MEEAEQLKRLDELRSFGLLTDVEYVYHKAKVQAEHRDGLAEPDGQDAAQRR